MDRTWSGVGSTQACTTMPRFVISSGGATRRPSESYTATDDPSTRGCSPVLWLSLTEVLAWLVTSERMRSKR